MEIWQIVQGHDAMRSARAELRKRPGVDLQMIERILWTTAPIAYGRDALERHQGTICETQKWSDFRDAEIPSVLTVVDEAERNRHILATLTTCLVAFIPNVKVLLVSPTRESASEVLNNTGIELSKRLKTRVEYTENVLTRAVSTRDKRNVYAVVPSRIETLAAYRINVVVCHASLETNERDSLTRLIARNDAVLIDFVTLSKMIDAN